MEYIVKYKNLKATYTSETAKILKDFHGLDIEEELLAMMKAEYDKAFAGVAQG